MQEELQGLTGVYGNKSSHSIPSHAPGVIRNERMSLDKFIVDSSGGARGMAAPTDGELRGKLDLGLYSAWCVATYSLLTHYISLL